MKTDNTKSFEENYQLKAINMLKIVLPNSLIQIRNKACLQDSFKHQGNSFTLRGKMKHNKEKQSSNFKHIS